MNRIRRSCPPRVRRNVCTQRIVNEAPSVAYFTGEAASGDRLPLSGVLFLGDGAELISDDTIRLNDGVFEVSWSASVRVDEGSAVAGLGIYVDSYPTNIRSECAPPPDGVCALSAVGIIVAVTNNTLITLNSLDPAAEFSYINLIVKKL